MVIIIHLLDRNIDHLLKLFLFLHLFNHHILVYIDRAKERLPLRRHSSQQIRVGLPVRPLAADYVIEVEDSHSRGVFISPDCGLWVTPSGKEENRTSGTTVSLPERRIHVAGCLLGSGKSSFVTSAHKAAFPFFTGFSSQTARVKMDLAWPGKA